MKKASAVLLILMSLIMPASCGKSEENSKGAKVYSFHGENEFMAVSDGVFVIDTDEDVFYGGNLRIKDESLFDGKKAFTYNTRFYIVTDGQENTLMSNSMTDYTGYVEINGDLGKISGGKFIAGAEAENIEEVIGNLFFVMTTVGTDGQQRQYSMQMDVTEVR